MASRAALDIVIGVKDQASAELARTSRSVQSFGREFRQAGAAVGRFGQAMTNILVLTNLLPGSIGKSVNQTLLLATTTINAVYAVSQLIRIYQSLNKTYRITIALQSVLHALSGAGIGKVALAAGVGAAAYAGMTALMNRGEGGGNTYNFNGPVLGSEAELARRLTEIQRQGTRLGR